MMATNSVAPPPTPLPLVSRQDSSVSLDRTTEQEAIIVDEGFCKVEDPTFGDAASRLACLELEDFETSSRPSSSKSLGARVSRSSVSSKSLKGSSSKSLQSGQKPTSPIASISSNSLATRSSSDKSVAPLHASVELLTPIRSGEGLPPGSPFGCEEFQSSTFPALDGDEAHNRLTKMDIDESLMAGLQSLSPDELSLYMQLTDQLIGEGVTQPPAAADSADSVDGIFNKSSTQEHSLEAARQDPRLEEAVQKLKALLPKSAIQQLQSHASYGLLDIVRCQPVTPPPTPTAKEDREH